MVTEGLIFGELSESRRNQFISLANVVDVVDGVSPTLFEEEAQDYMDTAKGLAESIKE